MKINVDIKSFVIGFLLAVAIVLVMGQTYGGAGKSDFGFAVERSGLTLVRADDGTVYVVDPQSSRAEIITYDDGPFRKQIFNLRRTITKETNKRSTNY